MKYVFATIGGSGSRELIRRLRTRYIVGDQPDRVFVRRLGALEIDQGKFEDWSADFCPPPGCGLRDAVAQYHSFLRQHPERTAVFNVAAERSIFSELGIRDVVFLIRHPAHAYASWAKPHRHGSLLMQFGGINSEEAVRWYGRRWRNTVDEYLRLASQRLGPRLVRYEQALRDGMAIPSLEWLFEGFDSTRRNSGVLSEEMELLLRDTVSATFDQIYECWKDEGCNASHIIKHSDIASLAQDLYARRANHRVVFSPSLRCWVFLLKPPFISHPSCHIMYTAQSKQFEWASVN